MVCGNAHWRGLNSPDLGGSSAAGKPPSSSPIQQAKSMAQQACWQTALWWVVRALEDEPGSEAANELFMAVLERLANGLTALPVVYMEKQAFVEKSIARGHLSPDEAQRIAGVIISEYYLASLIKQYAAFLVRIKQGEIKKAIPLASSDLEFARQMALDLGDEMLPDQTTPARWKSILTPQADAFLASGINGQREALVVLLQANTASDWQHTCRQLYLLWQNYPTETELAARFERMASDQLQESEFRVYRDGFINAFATNAIHLIQARNRLREPA